MSSTRPTATAAINTSSKLALLFLLEHLHARGLDWLDVQVLTPHVERLGAKLISRDQFLDKLNGALERGRELFPVSPGQG